MTETPAEAFRPARITVLGAAGVVGSSVAARLAAEGVGRHLYLQDLRSNLAEAHRVDIEDAQTHAGADAPQLHTGLSPSGTADLVVVAASHPESPAADRRDYLRANAALLQELIPTIRDQLAPHGAVLLLTNPVDILADWLVRAHGFEPHRLIGFSLNDSARFRRAVAAEFGVAVSGVEATVVGEHGLGQFPLFSSVRIDGQGVRWDEGARQRVEDQVQGWFGRYLSLEAGRSSGWATGSGVVSLFRALSRGDEAVTTACTHDVAGLPATYVTLPVTWRAEGFSSSRPATDEREWAKLVEIAEAIEAQAAELAVS